MSGFDNPFLPDSPNPAITLPTTRYISQRVLPTEIEAEDAHELRLAQAHPPLTVMLVLSQLGAGLALMNALTRSSRLAALVALAVTVGGVGIGTLHLGQPLKAWRSFLGWRKSWLSRELIAFGGFIVALAAHVVLLHPLSAVIAAVLAFGAVACSAMVYVDTRRPFWSARMTFGKFFGTTLLLGAAVTLFFATLTRYSPLSPVVAVLILLAGVVVKLAAENRIFRYLVDEQSLHLTALNKTALLLNGRLGRLSRLRIMCAVIGGGVLPLVIVFGGRAGTSPGIVLAVLALALCFAGELIERHLFFVADAAPKMPGGGQ